MGKYFVRLQNCPLCWMVVMCRRCFRKLFSSFTSDLIWTMREVELSTLSFYSWIRKIKYRNDSFKCEVMSIVVSKNFFSFVFSGFNYGLAGVVICFCCDAFFNYATVSSMVCINTMEHHSWRIHRLLAVRTRIDGNEWIEYRYLQWTSWITFLRMYLNLFLRRPFQTSKQLYWVTVSRPNCSQRFASVWLEQCSPVAQFIACVPPLGE